MPETRLQFTSLGLTTWMLVQLNGECVGACDEGALQNCPSWHDGVVDNPEQLLSELGTLRPWPRYVSGLPSPGLSVVVDLWPGGSVVEHYSGVGDRRAQRAAADRNATWWQR